MAYFLERIASHLIDEYSDRLDKQCLVFPSRRAGLYFLKYLSSKTAKPVWAPSVKTINELFTSCSSFKLAEPETLIFELYRVYKNLNPKAENFDEFYFWGDMIINDFDDVDKYLVDADLLFSNIGDLKRIDSLFGTLNEDQINIIRQFWVNFRAGSETRAKADFLSVWSILPDIYNKLRKTLASKGIAYEGMIFRELAESCNKGILPDLKWETFHFIGFNALSKCERSLLNALKKEGRARFYWDYDISYTETGLNHTAGFFIKNNLKEFGDDMPTDWSYSTYLSTNPGNIKRRIIETSSDIAQVKLIPDLLNDLPETEGDKACQTAIVLADESFLIPMLSTIPGSVEDVNITMGYPLKFSPVYSLIKHLLSLQRNSRMEKGEVTFDHNEVFSILKHSYFYDGNSFNIRSTVSELIKENRQRIPASRFRDIHPFECIFKRIDDPSLLPSYLRKVLEAVYVSDEDEESLSTYSGPEKMIRNEFIYRTLLVINRIESSIAGSEINLSEATWTKLLDKILKGISIPFSGEPLKGIQIMGILETRALDFRNLIILSVNEGKLPKSTAGSSFIPYNLREAFGLPTIRHQDSIYAYYFYRLLHKAENLTFIYNSSSEGLRTGEMSRFLLQLSFLESPPPDMAGVAFNITARSSLPGIIKKSNNHSLKLEELFLAPGRKALSPSAVNTWLNCRMKFYYKYICGLKEPEKILTEIDPSLFGALLHSILEKIYSPFKGLVIDKKGLRAILENDLEIRKVTEEVIKIKFKNGLQYELGGNEQIISGILQSYVRIILKKDAVIAPFTIMELEKSVSAEMKFSTGRKEIEVLTGGIIDRLDKTGNSIRVLDYKTGNVSMEISSVESLFDETVDRRNEAWFQVLMYCEILSLNDNQTTFRPSIYGVRNITEVESSDYLIIKIDKNQEIILDDYSKIRGTFKSGIEGTLEQLFSNNSDFSMTQHIRKCSYCPYKQLCRR